MSKMKLFQVYLPEEIIEKLKEEKKKIGAPIAELIRRYIAKQLSEKEIIEDE